MTTTEPRRGASPVRSASSSSTRSPAPCSAWPPLACLQKRKEKLCRTDLPVRSAPGVWLLVGVGVVLVGMCVAVAGYASASSAPKPLQGGRGTSHADRMKLAGPVVMGVGLFIFICSATLLYENRDSALLRLRPEPGDGDPVLVDEEEGCSPQRPCCSCRERKHRHHRSGDPEQGSWASSLSLAPSLCGDHCDDDDGDGDGDGDGDPGSPTPVRGHGVTAVSHAPGGRGGQSESPDYAEGRGRGGGGADGQQPEIMEVGFDEEELLECFRCDLGFWDACYTTTVYCSTGERCFTGRVKAVDLLDVKTQGCVKTEECSAETTLELYPNATLYTMTKHCCDTAFCNAAHTLPIGTSSYLTAPVLSLWYLTGAQTRLH
ncbi:unnamed protein product [Lota lota]